jgi:hypothetical protein
MSTIVELIETKSSCSGLEIRKYGRRDPSRRPRGTLYLNYTDRASAACRWSWCQLYVSRQPLVFIYASVFVSFVQYSRNFVNIKVRI